MIYQQSLCMSKPSRFSTNNITFLPQLTLLSQSLPMSFLVKSQIKQVRRLTFLNLLLLHLLSGLRGNGNPPPSLKLILPAVLLIQSTSFLVGGLFHHIPFLT